MWKDVSTEELRAIYDKMTMVVEAEGEFTTGFVGGQPADDKGLEAFCRHHLQLSDDEIPAAVARIKGEEVRSTSGPEDEVKEAESYGVCVIRKCEKGPWIGDWMVKACLKAAASRLGIFQQKKGAKGDLTHLGIVEPIELSRQCPHHGHIHLYTVERDGLTVRVPELAYEKFMGSVANAAGRVSIVHDSEVAAPGTRFAFRLRVPPTQFSEAAIKAMFSAIQFIGLGSVKPMERGKFKILRMRMNVHEKSQKGDKE
jgi:hypothetical protein